MYVTKRKTTKRYGPFIVQRNGFGWQSVKVRLPFLRDWVLFHRGRHRRG